MPDSPLPAGASGDWPADDHDVATDVRLAAMNLLARREHSLRELRNKLKRRFTDESTIDDQLSRLAVENLQSDLRFAEGHVRQRMSRGYGPLRLREELRERGVSDPDIDVALEAAEVDWSALAADVLARKFGEGPPADIKEKARRIRFMQYRGFATEHYRQLARS
jgi:regulatory protein